MFAPRTKRKLSPYTGSRDEPSENRAINRLINILIAVIAVSEFACAQAAHPPPNVVMILADDQSYQDFGFLGNDLVHTPNIDRLAENSARYPNGYVPMSVCRPSLATLLTGLYPHQHGIHFNHPPPGLRTMRSMTAEQYRQTRATTDYLIENVPTLPRVLAEHGYACLQTGKHWEGSYRTAGFTHGMTLGRPADRLGQVTGTREQANGEWVAHGNGDAGLVIGRETMQPIFDFVEDYAGEQPFFVWYAPFLPHVPFDAAPRFRELYRDKDVPAQLLPYYAEIARFDETVGKLLDHLEKKQLLSNTLIVFVSDNGFRPHKSGRETHNGRSKLSEYEDGLRTPILLSWDGRIKPADHSQLVHTVDLVPTILAATGLARETTDRMRGVDLLPSALGTKPLPDRAVFGAIYPNDAQQLGAPSKHVRGRWVRDGDFKLITPGPARNAIPLSLFNLKNDPGETTNLAAQPKLAATVRRLQQSLDAWWPVDDDIRVTKHKQAGPRSAATTFRH
ncbi:MAG: sulfatase family protein [Planctomycetota bacterium]